MESDLKRYRLPELPRIDFWTPTYIHTIAEKINALKEDRHALILAHNYVWDPVKDLADFVGDSLGLSQQAAKTDAKVIVFCGVYFMAETASILCPDKLVLLPNLQAGCSLSSSITADELRAWKQQHPKAVVVSYINTSAEVKAESDYCCTSGNAEKVIRAIPQDNEILFLPDKYLGYYLMERTHREMHIWAGECHVHSKINAKNVDQVVEEHPDAELLIHPECGCVSSCMYRALKGLPGQPKTYFLSTEGMVKHIASSPAREFAIATETGILGRMRSHHPNKAFYPVNEEAVCEFMKTITLEDVLRSLQELIHPVKVLKDIARRARKPIEKMLELA